MSKKKLDLEKLLRTEYQDFKSGLDIPSAPKIQNEALDLTRPDPLAANKVRSRGRRTPGWLAAAAVAVVILSCNYLAYLTRDTTPLMGMMIQRIVSDERTIRDSRNLANLFLVGVQERFSAKQKTKESES